MITKVHIGIMTKTLPYLDLDLKVTEGGGLALTLDQYSTMEEVSTKIHPGTQEMQIFEKLSQIAPFKN